MDRIANIQAFEILGARGKPTIEVELTTEKGCVASASVPSGTSKGRYEAFERYDGGTRYDGYGVRKAVETINTQLCEALTGMDVTAQQEIDRRMCDLDQTSDKHNLGGNAILAVSVAACKAGALSVGLPLYRYIGGLEARKLPGIVATVISGGSYSQSGLCFEDYMYLVDCNKRPFSECLETLVALRFALAKRLSQEFGAFPEDGGALAPPLASTEAALDIMMEVISQAGCQDYVTLGLDVAADEFYDETARRYRLGERMVSGQELLEYYQQLAAWYPLTYLEDGFQQDDFECFAKLKQCLPQIQVVGDDLFATNAERLEKGIALDCANTLLLKINQAGSLSDALDAAQTAKRAGYGITVSLRSGETTDPFIADLAVGLGARQIKLGSPVRGERNAKYNRLLRIEQEL